MARRWLHFALWALAALALLLCNQYAATLVPLGQMGIFWRQLIAVVYLVLLLLTLMQEARAATLLPQSGLFLLLIGLALAAPWAALLYLRTLRLVPPIWLLLTANSLFLPAAAALAGTALGRRFLRHPNTLVAAAGFAGFFDLVVVSFGTVAVLLQRAPHVISAASVGAPAALPHVRGPMLPPPISDVGIGPADVLFIALFLAAVARLGLESRATFVWIFLLLSMALALVQTNEHWSIPALAPMGVAVVLANARHTRFSREEKYALVYGGAFALALAVAMVAGARTLFAR